MTVYNSHTSGISAMRNDAVNRVVATLFFNLRLTLIWWNVAPLDRGGVECRLCHPLTLPPAASRASALTMNVSAKSTNPAAMYAPVGSGELNSAAAEAILDANV